ncbi:hypothetical protein A3Q40_03434 [Rhodococcus sp. PBTS 1]|nr:hypothetical protein A3Q40_03434 [Rhodococcus sp. PBTS 1]
MKLVRLIDRSHVCGIDMTKLKLGAGREPQRVVWVRTRDVYRFTEYELRRLGVQQRVVQVHTALKMVASVAIFDLKREEKIHSVDRLRTISRNFQA